MNDQQYSNQAKTISSFRTYPIDLACMTLLSRKLAIPDDLVVRPYNFESTFENTNLIFLSF